MATKVLGTVPFIEYEEEMELLDPAVRVQQEAATIKRSIAARLPVEGRYCVGLTCTRPP